MNQIHMPEGDIGRPVRNITWKEANEAERRREGKIVLETHRARAQRGSRTGTARRARTNGGDNGIAFEYGHGAPCPYERVLVSSIEGARYRIFRIFQWPRKARLGERI